MDIISWCCLLLYNHPQNQYILGLSSWTYSRRSAQFILTKYSSCVEATVAQVLSKMYQPSFSVFIRVNSTLCWDDSTNELFTASLKVSLCGANTAKKEFSVSVYLRVVVIWRSGILILITLIPRGSFLWHKKEQVNRSSTLLSITDLFIECKRGRSKINISNHLEL